MKVTVCKENESVIYNGNIYRNGQSFDVEDTIGKSLVERGYVTVDGAEPPCGEKALEDMTIPELKKIAAEIGVAATGRKEELIERIRTASNADESADETDAEEEAEGDESADDLPNTDMPE